MELRSIRRRLRSDGGFGLVELLIAMTILSVALFALLAAYTSSTTALMRASRVATAGTVANKQMELYRGLLYVDIGLDASTIPASGDPEYADYVGTVPPYQSGDAQVTLASCTDADACDASRPVTGPDGRDYQVDVYMYEYEVTPGGRETKRVSVVVRDTADASRVLARQTTTFDLYTGCAAGSC